MKNIVLLSSAHLHADAYIHELSTVSDARIVGVYDNDSARAEAAGVRYGIPVFPALDAALGASDAAIICSENIHHEMFALEAIKAGKHVLCEKPLATTPEAALRMINAADAAGVLLMTAFPCRFSPAYQQFKQLVNSGSIGDIRALRGTNQGMCPGGWFVQKELSGGGAVTDHTVHVTDLLRDLTGSEVESVYCELGNGLLHGDFEDTGVVTLEFEKDVFATLDASWSRPKSFTTWGNVTLYAVGTKGTLEMDMFNQEGMLYSDIKGKVGVQNWGSSIDRGMVAAFVDSLLSGTLHEKAASGTDGLRAVEVVEAAYASTIALQPAKVNHRT